MKALTAAENAVLWRFCEIAASRMNAHKTGHKLNFRCNVCGDGHRKRRGYLVYDLERELIYYKCFNEGDCAAAGDGNAWHGSKWLKFTDETLYRQFRREISAAKTSKKKLKLDQRKPKQEEKNPAPAKEKSPVQIEFERFLPMKKCPPELKPGVLKFCKSRRIPIERVREMRIPGFGKYYGRIAIPAFDETGSVTYFQCRTLVGQTPKYLNSVAPREKVLFGIDRVDRKKPVFVLEGPIDAMFVENSVATLGCSYSKEVAKILDGMDCLYLMDNDRAGHSKSRALLMEGKRVFLWSKFLKDKGLPGSVKDVNEYVVATGSGVLKANDLIGYFSDSPLSLARLIK